MLSHPPQRTGATMLAASLLRFSTRPTGSNCRYGLPFFHGMFTRLASINTALNSVHAAVTRPSDARGPRIMPSRNSNSPATRTRGEAISSRRPTSACTGSLACTGTLSFTVNFSMSIAIRNMWFRFLTAVLLIPSFSATTTSGYSV